MRLHSLLSSIALCIGVLGAPTALSLDRLESSLALAGIKPPTVDSWANQESAARSAGDSRSGDFSNSFGGGGGGGLFGGDRGGGGGGLSGGGGGFRH
jgi:hypothetical protein